MRKLLQYLKPYWVYAVLAPLLMMLEVAMDLMQPKLIQRIIDVGIAQGDASLVIRTGLTMIGVAFVGLLGGVGCTAFSILASQGFGFSLRNDLFKKVQELSLGNLDRLETGQLITRLTNDVVQVQETVSMGLRILVRAPLLVIGSLIMAVITSPGLALILAVAAPLLLGAIGFLMKRARPLFMQVQDWLDSVNAIVQENLRGIRVVKAFARSGHEIHRFSQANQTLMTKNVQVARLLAGMMPIMLVVLNFGVVAVLWFGGNQVALGRLQVGALVAFINYLLQMLSSLMMVGMLLSQVSRAEASADRIQEVFAHEPEIKERVEAKDAPVSQGRVVFDHVSLTYDGNYEAPVLRDITFSAEPGETVGIVGATGSGKSSLVHLIPRLYDPIEGTILIDGQDIRSLKERALRQNIGLCFQESLLFSGSIRDNIRYGRPTAGDDEVERAAKAAHAHDFIMTLSEGYDTHLGQRGLNLSGGQRQRIAIARALLTNPKILILDDSTSAVDAVTEVGIRRNITSLGSNPTTFIIAQRIGSVVQADRILVLEQGKIAAQGTHYELLRSSSVYREIYRSQLGEEAANA